MAYGIKRGSQMVAGGYAAICNVCATVYPEPYFVDCWGECRCPKCRAHRVEHREAKGKSGPKREPTWPEPAQTHATWDQGGD